ncbi:MAG: hypothetical protein K2J16_00345, partial [Clostridia bacterium]|nr:hypothetical protein [Clostridia bacterium]
EYPNDMEQSAGEVPRVLNIRYKRKRKDFVDVKAMTIIFFRQLKKFGYKLLTNTRSYTIVSIRLEKNIEVSIITAGFEALKEQYEP